MPGNSRSSSIGSNSPPRPAWSSVAPGSSGKPITPPLRASPALRTRSRSAFYGLQNLAHRALLCLRFLRFLRLPAPFMDWQIWRTAALYGTRISRTWNGGGPAAWRNLPVACASSVPEALAIGALSGREGRLAIENVGTNKRRITNSRAIAPKRLNEFVHVERPVLRHVPICDCVAGAEKRRRALRDAKRLH